MTDVLTKGIKYLTDKRYRFSANVALGKYDNMPDDEFIKKQWENFYNYGGEKNYTHWI